jgi:AraC-like DNA-binding protein
MSEPVRTLERPASLPSEPATVPALRRRFDQLTADRLTPGAWVYAEAEADAAEWPFLLVYAGDASVRVRQHEAAVVLGPGSLLLTASDRATRLRSDGGTAMVLRLPASAVRPYLRILDDVAGRVWEATDGGSASLVRHLLDGLMHAMDGYTPGSPGRLAQHLVGLLTVMFADASRGLEEDPEHGILQDAQEYIERNLADPVLSPDRVAAALFVSTRSLHRLFEAEGLTVSGWIRQRRLENCRIDLDDLSYDALPVARIGAKWGLREAAHFSRIFKTAYGYPPRQYRIAKRRGLVAVV